MKPIYIRLKKGRHKTQPWTFEVDKPGNASKQTKRERYVAKWSAFRGAIRQLGLKWQGLKYGYIVTIKGKERPVKMIVVS